MDPLDSTQGMPTWLSVLLIVALVLAVLAVVNHAVARWAERRHPPEGEFIEVDGTRLHYSDRGTGRPVVLLHGNVVTGADYNTSGVAERLVGTYRVITFDRPGFGHSQRPRGRRWTAGEQADLIHAALERLSVGRAVVVGHSWGTLVALALAERHPAGLAGLVLLSGYYFPVPRLDALLVMPAALPVLGDILRHTVSPLFGWLSMPLMKRAMFAPAPVAERFKREYSTAMALRPSQLRATASDGALMVSDAKELSAGYGALPMPVTIVAGSGDKVVSPDHAERLRGAVPDGTLRTVEGAGHMVHHVATRQVVEAIQEVARRSKPASADQALAPRPTAERVPVTRMADINKPQDAKQPTSQMLAGNVAQHDAHTVADAASDAAQQSGRAPSDALRQNAEVGSDANDTAPRGTQAVAESQRQIAQDAAERFEEVSRKVAEAAQDTTEDVRRPMPLPNAAEGGLQDLQQGMGGLVEGVTQTNLRAAQELFRLANPAPIVELQQRFAREYTDTLLRNSATLARAMRRTADETLRPLEQQIERQQREQGGQGHQNAAE